MKCLQIRMGECHLDDLLDILDEDEFTEEDVNNADEEKQISAQRSPPPTTSSASPAEKPGSSEKADPEKEALKRKLQQMEEQMKMIKSQLGQQSEETQKRDSGSIQEVDMFASNSNASDDKRLNSPVKVGCFR